MKLLIRNRTRNTVLADAAEVAGTSEQRREGLLKRSGMQAGEGLWIIPCEAVHTFFMKFTIDVLFLNKKKVVVKARRGLKPWRISGALRAHSVVELPEGQIDATGTRAGDEIEISELEKA